MEYTTTGGIKFFISEPGVSAVIIRVDVLRQAGVILAGPVIYTSLSDEKLYFPIGEYEKLKKIYPRLETIIDQEQKKFLDLRGPRRSR